MAELLLGKEVNGALNRRISDDVLRLKEKGIVPTLAILRVGENPGDLAYERGAKKRCEALGVECTVITFDENVLQEELLSCIDRINRDDTIHGVLLLRPLPRHLDASVIENAVSAEKDVDCMTDLSISGVFSGRNIGYPPCTAQACIEILDHYGIDCTGKKAVVVGRSLVVGKPVSMMLLQKNATVTICHTRTKDLSSVGSVFTVESCFYAENGGAIMYSGPGNNTSLPMLKLDQGLYKQRGLKYSLGSYTNTNSTLSLTDGLGIRNGVTLSGTGSDFWGNDCFSIGSGFSFKRYRHQFKGKVFSVRVYSRILTQSEMLFNQSVDNTRFNLGLTL